MTKKYNQSLFGIPMPLRIARLPVDARGFPVPWFVFWHDEKGNPTFTGQGTPDFRVLGPGKFAKAISQHRCWVCGDKLGTHLAFPIGPMCSVNRVSAEPPCHRECAEFSVRACPFLTNPRMRRNESGLPDEKTEPEGMLKHNPGVTAIWMTSTYETFRTDTGLLVRIGRPESVDWFTEGRPATRAEVEAAFDRGIPILREEARRQGTVEQTEKDIVLARRSYMPRVQASA